MQAAEFSEVPISSITAHRYPSKRPGYKTPSRVNKEAVITYLPPGYREDLNKIASIQGVSAKELLATLVTELVNRHRGIAHLEQVVVQNLPTSAQPAREAELESTPVRARRRRRRL